MNYEQSLDYIHSICWTFCKPGLERISELCRKLGDPQKKLRFIHAAGTNGKGSFCSMSASVLRKAGYKTGLFTSPYVRFFNERMQINGEPISNDELAEITSFVRPAADAMEDKPTEFELITAIAFVYFCRHGCDVVVLEAGMGGRLDSTNVIDAPLLSVITGIALDHTAFLGDTVEKIAAEKAGIIKCGAPVLFGGEDKAAAAVIKNSAEAKGSEYFCTDYSSLFVKMATLEGCEFDYRTRIGINIRLLGLYQPKNAALVCDAMDILREKGLDIPEKAIYEGLEAATWPARFEILTKEPLIIFDGAHNPQGIDSAVRSIKHYFGNTRVLVLTGVLSDKDYAYIARRLSEIAKKVFTATPDNPRALPAGEYAECISAAGAEAEAFDSLASAFLAAKESAVSSSTPLVCLGSLYTYPELLKLI